MGALGARGRALRARPVAAGRIGACGLCAIRAFGLRWWPCWLSWCELKTSHRQLEAPPCRLRAARAVLAALRAPLVALGARGRALRARPVAYNTGDLCAMGPAGCPVRCPRLRWWPCGVLCTVPWGDVGL